MNIIRISCITALVAGIATMAAAAPAEAKLKGAALANGAKVSLAVARQTALKARPGTITDQELEKEKGGSGLRYSFDITSYGKAYEVGIDAKTGTILENAAEGRHPD
jgi:uncharacterized membrane protein YkoI